VADEPVEIGLTGLPEGPDAITIESVFPLGYEGGPGAMWIGERTAVEAYDVGTYNALKARSPGGDALDIHHAGQAHAFEQLIPGYNRVSGPAIALPEAEHALIPTIRGATTLTPRQILANDIWNLRNFTNAPNTSLQDLIRLNKNMYPKAFKK
jgi:hypothetical protein